MLFGSCCCGPTGCSGNSADAIADYIEANAFDLRLTITSDDITTTAACTSGDCSALVGVYTLPYLSRPSGTTLRWQDDFTMTICGSSQSVRARVDVTLADAGGVTVGFSVFVSTGPFGSIYADLAYLSTHGPYASCHDVVLLSATAAPYDPTGSGRRCFTFGTEGSVLCEILGS